MLSGTFNEFFYAYVSFVVKKQFFHFGYINIRFGNSILFPSADLCHVILKQ
jgi:hypothetical protein